MTGTVRLDGELLQQGTVTFLPKSVGAAVYGQVRDDGTFQIKTGDIGGMASGEYTVTVRCVEEIPDKDPNNPPHFKTLIPLKYKNPSTSGLSFEVVPGKNHFEIELARK